MAETKVAVPAAPSVLPEEVAKKWAAEYEEAYKEAARDENNNESACQGYALRQANRHLRVAEPKSLGDLKPWQIYSKKEKDGKVTVVTIDGRKYRFDAPKAAKPEQKPA